MSLFIIINFFFCEKNAVMIKSLVVHACCKEEQQVLQQQQQQQPLSVCLPACRLSVLGHEMKQSYGDD
jgi:hypothetical protein